VVSDNDRDPLSVGWTAWIRGNLAESLRAAKDAGRKRKHNVSNRLCVRSARSAGEPGRRLALARRRKSHHPRPWLAHCPAAREDFCGAESATEMVAALAPIKAAPAERAPPARQCGEIDAAIGKEAASRRRQMQCLAAPEDEPSPAISPARARHRCCWSCRHWCARNSCWRSRPGRPSH